MLRPLAAGVLGLGAWIAACSPAGPGPATPPAAPASAAAAAVQVTRHGTLGALLSDGAGRTLYAFTADGPNRSTCNEGCVQVWPPLKAQEPPRSGEGLRADLLATFARADGLLQVSYNAKPLYYFSGDSAAGDAKGQNVGGNWFVVSPAGELVKEAPASVNPAHPPAPAGSDGY